MKNMHLAIAVAAAMVLSALAVPAGAATQAQIEQAITNGLAWLASQQNSDGSWSGTSYTAPVAYTGFAVAKLEQYAFELGYASPFDAAYPYKTNVTNGLNYLFSQAKTNGSVPGFCFMPGQNYETYCTGIAMIAIASSGAPTNIVNVTNSIVNGMTYKAVLQEIVDYFAADQNPDGGWRYYDSSKPSDNSNTGFAVMGLRYAAAPIYGFECTIPATVMTGLNNWINAIQVSDGGSGYTGNNNVNLLKTGNLLFEMSFVGDNTSTPRVQRAIAYIQTNWNDNNESPGWMPHNDLAMYCLMEGFGSLGITNITVSGTNVDWFGQFVTAILANQQTNGSWPADGAYGDTMLSTEWSLLVLEKVSPPIDALQITPTKGFDAAGCVGGPFIITNEIFSLTNIGTNPLTWSLANTSNRLDASPSGGTLTPGGPAATVTVSLSSNDYSLTSGIYTATVWFANLNDGFVQSRQFTLAVGLPPVITAEPINQTVMAGGMATFSVAVSGTGPFTYQWQFDGTNLPNGIIATVAGNGNPDYSGDSGLATNASLNGPCGVAVDASGNLFIADTWNNVIRKVDNNRIENNGMITTVAGNGNYGYSGDGGLATNASLSLSLYGGSANSLGLGVVALDASGNLFIADTENSRIREVDPYGIIATVVGNGNFGYSGDGFGATCASLYWPCGVAVDGSGNLFIADGENNRIRKVDTNGIITTVAGNGTDGYSGDGSPATSASLSNPSGVAVDAFDNLFIADTGNIRIRKVDTNLIITTVAGGGSNKGVDYNGPATNASLAGPYPYGPSGVAVDASDNLFIADTGNNVIRKVDPNGIITTVAGGGNGGIDYNGPATDASLSYPEGVGVDASGNLFIADSGNNVIREVVLPANPTLMLYNVSLTNAGTYTVIITNLGCSVTSSNATLTVTPEDLQITPPTGFEATGYVGRPFPITNETFSLTNTGTSLLDWSLVITFLPPCTSNCWLNASSGGGPLAAGRTTNVTVSLNSYAYSLPSGIYTAAVWFINTNDNVGQSRLFTLVVTGIPTLAIQTATPGLRIFAGASGISNRQELATAPGADVNWVGASGGTPVKYSFTILRDGAQADYFQTHILLVPINTIINLPGQGPTNNGYADWQASNALWLQIYGTNGSPAVTANVSWKTNSPNANPSIVALSINNSTLVGTWTLAFTSPTTGSLTAPGGSATNFTISDPNASADFAGPVTAYFGVQANTASAIGGWIDYSQISITGVENNLLTENFLTDTTATFNPQSINPNDLWAMNPDSATNAMFLVTSSDPYWITWSPPDTGFGLGVCPGLPVNHAPGYQYPIGPFNGTNSFVLPSQFHGDTPVIGNEGGTNWALIPADCLPSYVFPTVTNAFFELMNPPPSN
jgi:sugar lactone lactonase YvrE